MPATSGRWPAVSTYLTWAIVLGSPLAAGLAVRREFPGWPPWASWALAAALLAVGIVLADWLWRGLRWLLGESPPHPAPQRQTAGQRAAEIVSEVLANERIRYTDVVRRWPEGSTDPLLAEAFALLRDCADTARDRFDQARLNQNLWRLSDLMNRLRA